MALKCCHHVLGKGWVYGYLLGCCLSASGDGMKFCPSAPFACVHSEKHLSILFIFQRPSGDNYCPMARITMCLANGNSNSRCTRLNARSWTIFRTKIVFRPLICIPNFISPFPSPLDLAAQMLTEHTNQKKKTCA